MLERPVVQVEHDAERAERLVADRVDLEPEAVVVVLGFGRELRNVRLPRARIGGGLEPERGSPCRVREQLRRVRRLAVVFEGEPVEFGERIVDLVAVEED